MIKKISRNAMREARHTRVRNDVHGTSAVPRLNVFRSNSNIFAQIIDDKELKLENGSNIEAATKVGELIADRAVKANIKKVVFDRGGYLYHGRVKALAEAARNKGLEF